MLARRIRNTGKHARLQDRIPRLILPGVSNYFPQSQVIVELSEYLANTLYDPNVAATLEKVARLAGQYERAVIGINGHTDSSMKDSGVPYTEVKQLSLDRANAVKDALIKVYKFDPNKFVVQGMAWDQPADPSEPGNQALNRRVEIAIYPPESK